MRKDLLLIIVCLIGIVSSIANIKYQFRIENLIIEKEKLILEIKEKNQLIEDYKNGINEIEFVDECFLGE